MHKLATAQWCIFIKLRPVQQFSFQCQISKNVLEKGEKCQCFDITMTIFHNFLLFNSKFQYKDDFEYPF